MPNIPFGKNGKSPFKTLAVYSVIVAVLGAAALSPPGRLVGRALWVGVRDMAEAYLPKAEPPPPDAGQMSSTRLAAPKRTLVRHGDRTGAGPQEVRRRMDGPDLDGPDRPGFLSTSFGKGIAFMGAILLFFLFFGAALFRNRDNQGRGFF